MTFKVFTAVKSQVEVFWVVTLSGTAVGYQRVGEPWKGKGAGKFPVLFFNWALRHESVFGSGGIVPWILDLGTRWRVVSFTPRRFNPRERSPGTHWIGGWVGPSEPVWTRWWGEKFPLPSGTRTPDQPARSPAPYSEDPAASIFRVKTGVEVFWVVTPCSVAVGHQSFGGPCCLHLRDQDSGRGLLDCDAVYCCGRIPTFRRSMLPPSSGWTRHGADKCTAH